MSSILYGRLTKTVESTPALQLTEAEPTPAERLAAFAQKVAALVPAEVLTVHAIVLAYATSSDDDGSTIVEKPDLLKATFVVLLITAAILYAIGRYGPPAWKPVDWLRMILPAIAFAAWTMLTGTSAATPWFEDIDRGWLLLAGGVAAALALAIADRVVPKSGTT